MIDPNGKPHIPGSLEVWRNLFVNHPQGKYDGKLTKLATTWKDPDDVLEALFALSRKTVENEPLKIFMAVSDIDRNRTHAARRGHGGSPGARISQLRQPVSAVQRIARAEREIDRPVPGYGRGDHEGEGSGAALRRWRARSNRWWGCGRSWCGSRACRKPRRTRCSRASWAAFAQIKNERDVFDAGRNGVKLLLGSGGHQRGAAREAAGTGGGRSDDSETHEAVVQELMRILEAQRIISLDTLFQLADHIEAIAKGEKLDPKLVNKLASRISEIQLPRASLIRE